MLLLCIKVFASEDKLKSKIKTTNPQKTFTFPIKISIFYTPNYPGSLYMSKPITIEQKETNMLAKMSSIQPEIDLLPDKIPFSIVSIHNDKMLGFLSEASLIEQK